MTGSRCGSGTGARPSQPLPLLGVGSPVSLLSQAGGKTGQAAPLAGRSPALCAGGCGSVHPGGGRQQQSHSIIALEPPFPATGAVSPGDRGPEVPMGLFSVFYGPALLGSVCTVNNEQSRPRPRIVTPESPWAGPRHLY